LVETQGKLRELESNLDKAKDKAARFREEAEAAAASLGELQQAASAAAAAEEDFRRQMGQLEEQLSAKEGEVKHLQDELAEAQVGVGAGV
jgi:chromosome segregation ATPase